MKQTIKLGTEVMVSDPCYSSPTWFQSAVIDNVKSGEYEVSCKSIELEGWGNRNSLLIVVHKGYEPKELKWMISTDVICVDSGQAGIFDMNSYRKNPEVVPIGGGDISFFDEAEDESDMWYQKICSHTLNENGWGVYESGAVSRSGIGDGSYNLFLAFDGEEVIGFIIDFGIEEFSEPKQLNQLI